MSSASAAMPPAQGCRCPEQMLIFGELAANLAAVVPLIEQAVA
jgi:hypothetical protein